MHCQHLQQEQEHLEESAASHASPAPEPTSRGHASFSTMLDESELHGLYEAALRCWRSGGTTATLDAHLCHLEQAEDGSLSLGAQATLRRSVVELCAALEVQCNNGGDTSTLTLRTGKLLAKLLAPEGSKVVQVALLFSLGRLMASSAAVALCGVAELVQALSVALSDHDRARRVLQSRAVAVVHAAICTTKSGEATQDPCAAALASLQRPVLQAMQGRSCFESTSSALAVHQCCEILDCLDAVAVLNIRDAVRGVLVACLCGGAQTAAATLRLLNHLVDRAPDVLLQQLASAVNDAASQMMPQAERWADAEWWQEDIFDSDMEAAFESDEWRFRGIIECCAKHATVVPPEMVASKLAACVEALSIPHPTPRELARSWVQSRFLVGLAVRLLRHTGGKDCQSFADLQQRPKFGGKLVQATVDSIVCHCHPEIPARAATASQQSTPLCHGSFSGQDAEPRMAISRKSATTEDANAAPLKSESSTEKGASTSPLPHRSSFGSSTTNAEPAEETAETQRERIQHKRPRWAAGTLWLHVDGDDQKEICPDLAADTLRLVAADESCKRRRIVKKSADPWRATPVAARYGGC